MDIQRIKVHFSCLSRGTVSVLKSQGHLLRYILQQFVKGKKILCFIMSFLKMLGAALETFFHCLL